MILEIVFSSVCMFSQAIQKHCDIYWNISTVTEAYPFKEKFALDFFSISLT